MLVDLFGATSSPSCANFALRKMAEDYATDFNLSIYEIVKKNFYVNDCLKSINDVKEGVKVVKNLLELLSHGGFHLMKWVSNSAKVIESVPEGERAGIVKDLSFLQPTIQQALGKRWDVVVDIKEKPPTRHGLLSIISSIYDPLGFVTPFILSVKILMQQLCKESLSWDDPIPGEYLKCWNVWTNKLPNIQQFHVSRCIKPPTLKGIVSTQLHMFADASECGYGAVSYLQFEDEEGNIHCSFMMAKSRVALLKKTTIPRMELAAAVCATKLGKLVRKESNVKVKTSVFWMDSTCILGYLNNTTKRYQTFVGNRIATIREDSECSQRPESCRRHVPRINSKRWINGPQFLSRPKDCWPTQPSTTPMVNNDDPEVRSDVQTFSVRLSVQNYGG